MAVPKKKISYSKSRKRLLAKKDKLNLYIQCENCLNFIKLHHSCPSCSGRSLFSQQVDNNFKTNINKLYENNF